MTASNHGVRNIFVPKLDWLYYMSVETKIINLLGKKVFYRYTGDPGGNGKVLLTHGMRFTSEDWLRHDLLERIANLGFEVYAIDYPGFGKSETNESAVISSSPSGAGNLIEEFTRSIGGNWTCIVGPSMGGMIALSAVISHPDRFRSAVVIGSAGFDALKPRLTNIRIPVLILWGENDPVIDPAVGRKFQEIIPNSTLHILKSAGHAAYLDSPDEFLDLLNDFLSGITGKSNT